MSLKAIASLIPDEYRREILETNMIATATSSATSAPMVYLFTVWTVYVEPNQSLALECGLCLERILKNYRQLQPVLVELEQKSRLLDHL